MAGQPFEIDLHAIFKLDTHRVIATTGLDESNVTRISEDALAEQKARGEVCVLAGRSHRDRHAARLASTARIESEANFQRFFDGHPVLHGFAQISADPLNLDFPAAVCHCVVFRRLGRSVYRSHAV